MNTIISHFSYQSRLFKNRYLLSSKRKKGPDFLIIGAQKCGTTVLAVNLSLHPDIYMPRTPTSIELHYFDRDKNWRKGRNWYLSHFDRPDCLQGEKTPNYLYPLKCHERLYQTAPDAKLVIMLRNPVDRAYSQWNHFNQIYSESKHFGWTKDDFEKMLNVRPELLKRGEYILHIANLLQYYKKEQIFFLISERMKTDLQVHLNKLYSFLGVSSEPAQYRKYHVRSYPEPMNSETRQKLLKYYGPLNDQLFNFLGEEIEEWKK